MKLVTCCFLSFFSAVTHGTGCENIENPDDMYNRFLQIAYEKSIVEGEEALLARLPSTEEASEGWNCIEKATQHGNCSAIHIQELYYRHGVDEDSFGVIKNQEKAEHYLELKKELCGV